MAWLPPGNILAGGTSPLKNDGASDSTVGEDEISFEHFMSTRFPARSQACLFD